MLQHADLDSKRFDETAYSLDFYSFWVILVYLSDIPIDVDVMANLWNRKTNYFFSKLDEWGCFGVNFFSQLESFLLDKKMNLYWQIIILYPYSLAYIERKFNYFSELSSYI